MGELSIFDKNVDWDKKRLQAMADMSYWNDDNPIRLHDDVMAQMPDIDKFLDEYNK